MDSFANPDQWKAKFMELIINNHFLHAPKFRKITISCIFTAFHREKQLAKEH